MCFDLLCYVTVQEEAVIHFEDDIEELQQWDQQVHSLSGSYICLCFFVWNMTEMEAVQISGLCQALNDILDGMAKKGLPVPV